MNDYEARRAEKIKRNQQLLAELDIKSVVPPSSRRTTPQSGPDKKKRKLTPKTPAAPSRTSARIASSQAKPSYTDEPDIFPATTARRKPTTTSKSTSTKEEPSSPDLPPLTADLDSLQSSWTTWTPSAPPPTRNTITSAFHFPDFPDFTPNLSPYEILRQGAFGGTYYRPLYSKRLGIVVERDWRADLPSDWVDGLDVGRYLVGGEQDKEVNKFGVLCGQAIEEWEANGWIEHRWDVRGWVQWYVRFFRGRRTGDGEDERQVGRWKRCVGARGRWKRALLKAYVRAGVREVFEMEGDEGVEVSPVMHQTCHHWGYEVRQGDLEGFWAEG